jgi:hypothetical protein
VLFAQQRPCILHAGDDAVAPQHGDMGFRQQARCRRSARPGTGHQRAGLGDRAKNAGDADEVIAARCA